MNLKNTADKSKINLKGMTLEEMEDFLVGLGEKKFRGRQLFGWIYCKGVDDFTKMSDISKKLQSRLAEVSYISRLEVVERSRSETGYTEKFLFKLEDGNAIEAVQMRYNQQSKGRSTVCISSQVGCAQGCLFCASGRHGLVRNLTCGEIVDQVIRMEKVMNEKGERIHNVVIMGIGEPLANYDNTVKAIRLLNHCDGVAIGMRSISVSTVGIPALIRKFAKEKFGLRFAVSLHAPDNKTRSKIMPVNERHPVKELIDACRYYQKMTGKRITFEYMLVEGLNDSLPQAHRLARLLKGLQVLVNLIPLNPVEHFPYRRPSEKRCREFADELVRMGVNAKLRLERGVGIDAACGQLRLRNM